MLKVRDDFVAEIECDKCGLLLTECITGDLPKDTPAAMVAARNEGWKITLSRQICLGCKNV